MSGAKGWGKSSRLCLRAHPTSKDSKVWVIADHTKAGTIEPA